MCIVRKRKSSKRKKPTLENVARKLASIAEKHLRQFTPDERDSRVAAFERAIFRASRAKSTRPSKSGETRVSRVAVQARGSELP